MNFDYTLMQCGECGIQHQVPTAFYEERRKNTNLSWCCPNGHSRVFKESTADKMRRERDKAIQENARLEELRQEAIKRAEKAEASERRIKKRTQSGVCTCCNRSFANVARHMATKHPEKVKPKLMVCK